MHFQILDNFHEEKCPLCPPPFVQTAADSTLEAVAFLIEAVEGSALLAAYYL